MRCMSDFLLPGAIAITALFYAAVGQAGATGYLALFGLVGLASAEMKVSALALNILVAAIETWQFRRAGLLDWRSFYPFGVLGIPFSLLGGALHLPGTVYGPVVGCLLCLAAAQMALRSIRHVPEAGLPHHPPFLPALFAGAIVGFVSGLTGSGGGIFLAPIILHFGWVEPRRAAGVTAAYNLLNSAAALAGSVATIGRLPPALPLWLAAAGIGGLLGSAIGVRLLPASAMRALLAGLLLIAGAKLILT